MSLKKIFGLHAVQAALEYSPGKIKLAWLDKNRQDRRLNALSNEMNDAGVTIEKVDRRLLDRLTEGKNHQGVVVEMEMPREKDENDLKQSLGKIQGNPFFLVLDHVQDPHNLGACLRTADAAGVHGVVVTKDQAAGIGPTVCKVASGAAETVPVYQVTNLNRTLRWLKEQGVWVIGAAGDAPKTVYQTDLTGPLALVVGAEGAGMRRLVKEQCDLLVKIPMSGVVESLNLSVAAGVLLYEALRQRL
ncbi:MAG: 23S rRNA (guanosine(2251)-2'-O)-methyltransferase RlmB [Gammaproteobacteria bacterium]